jgi:hypothetical protein
MHGLHDSALTVIGGLVSLFAILAIALAAIRKDLHKVLEHLRGILQDLGWPDHSPYLPYDPAHPLFPKQSLALATQRAVCPHSFGFYIDGSVPTPQQLGAVKFGCVNCGLELKTRKEFLDYLPRR